MTSYLSWINPLAYLPSSEWLPGYGCRAPSVAAIKKKIESPKFVNVSETQLQEIIKNLKPIPPRAPPFPMYIFLCTPDNLKDEIESFKDVSPSEILKNLKNNF